jgi:hypothetical protein
MAKDFFSPMFWGEVLEHNKLWLVVSIPLKNMSSSDWIIIPTIGENHLNVPNHQPEIVVFYGFLYLPG